MVNSELTLYVCLLLLALCSIQSLPYINSPDNLIYRTGNKAYILPVLLTVVCIFWFGNRQLFHGGYMDTANYALQYIRTSADDIIIDFRGEWLWELIRKVCKKMDLDVQTYMIVIEAGYLTTLLVALFYFLPRNVYLGILFAYSSLFFLPFGVNGLRNGLACHIVLMGLGFVYASKFVPGIITLLAAFSIHKSTMLPIAATVASLYLIKNVQHAIYIWFAAIVASFFAGGFFINFFAGLGFDDRMAQYASIQDDTDTFSSTGFRWDFLLYSSFPIIMAYIVCIRKAISDRWYNALCITYILCNSMWVLVIRASYSNRFAYLSWFLYPFVIAYPLIMLPAWANQDQVTGFTLLGYIGFTILMYYLWHTF